MRYKILEPLEFCDTCFHRGKTDLCETFKNTFTKTSPLHFSQQRKLDRILNKLDSRPRLIDRRWVCIIESQKRKEFLDSLWGINVTVHTLEDHLRVITRFYKPEMREIGTNEQIELLNEESWEEFNPKSRNWDILIVKKKNEKFLANANLGNILRCKGPEATSYFRVNSEKGFNVLVPMERRAAYNIISTIAEPSVAYWKTDTTNEHGFIEQKELQNIPDEISNFLLRLGTKYKKFPEIIVFEYDDFDLVKSVLGCIKIDLQKSSQLFNGLLDKKADSKILIEDIAKERLQILLDIVTEMGGKIKSENDRITISGNLGSIKLTFVQDDKSAQDGSSIWISISVLEEPLRFAEILRMVKKRLGLHDLPLEIMISQHWPIITDSDLQYVLQSAISWWPSNRALAAKIISENNKFDKIKEWHSKIKEGKIRSNLDTITLGKIIKHKESNLTK